MQQDMWTYHGEPVAGLDLTGFDVHARDGEIGRVDVATYDVGVSYIVVDTGPWIFGKRVVLPAGLLERIDDREARIYVDRTKDEIRDAPEYDAARGSDEAYRGELAAYYAGRMGNPLGWNETLP
jgi:hypothetical protein